MMAHFMGDSEPAGRILLLKKLNVARDSLIRLSGVIPDLPDPGPGRLFF
jgi:hypothetical protein